MCWSDCIALLYSSEFEGSTLLIIQQLQPIGTSQHSVGKVETVAVMFSLQATAWPWNKRQVPNKTFKISNGLCYHGWREIAAAIKRSKWHLFKCWNQIQIIVHSTSQHSARLWSDWKLVRRGGGPLELHAEPYILCWAMRADEASVFKQTHQCWWMRADEASVFKHTHQCCWMRADEASVFKHTHQCCWMRA